MQRDPEIDRYGVTVVAILDLRRVRLDTSSFRVNRALTVYPFPHLAFDSSGAFVGFVTAVIAVETATSEVIAGSEMGPEGELKMCQCM